MLVAFGDGRDVNILPLVDHLGSVASFLSLPAAVIAMGAWLRGGRGRGRKITLLVALPVAISAYAIDVSERLGLIKFSERLSSDMVLSWGRTQGAFGFEMVVNSRQLIDYRDKYKMMLIVRCPYGYIDSVTDTAIEKSILYTITGDITPLVILMPPKIEHLRVIPPTETKGEFSVMVDFLLVIIPNNLSAEQIRSLSDVGNLGGRIIGASAAAVPFMLTEKQGT
jgi:hypothetical protein